MNALDCQGAMMIRTRRSNPLSPARHRWAALLLAGTMLGAGAAPAAAAGAAGESFPAPDPAVEALAAAWHHGRSAELLAIFGPGGNKLVNSGDPVADRRARARLAAAWDTGHRIEGVETGRATLVLGAEEWPYPIPLVKRGPNWRFDLAAGAQQILDRRIGRNELHAIETCRIYVEAQRDYAAEDGNAAGLHEYARRLDSTPGRHDGLYWRAAQGDEESPLGPLAAAAEAQGYGRATAEGKAPFQGYYYRILEQQGRHAPGGARRYVVDGHMTSGFALLAFPAKYRDSGVMSFIVDQDGIVFERDLGRDTAALARRITGYDPDSGWKAVAP